MLLRGFVLSDMLEMETGITILTPSADSAHRPHRVVYLLHGLFGRNGDWADYTMLPTFAGDYNAVFVMPEVARSFYSDMVYGQKFFSYITEELPRICRNTFNISAKPEDTAVIGASMGGYGALKAALSKPAQYGYCCAFSSAWLFTKEMLDELRTEQGKKAAIAHYGRQMVTDTHSIFGERLEWKPESDILELAKRAQEEPAQPRIYCACGTEDFLHADNDRFQHEMEKLELDFTYEEWKGRHDWYFFNDALKKGLDFCFNTPL